MVSKLFGKRTEYFGAFTYAWVPRALRVYNGIRAYVPINRPRAARTVLQIELRAGLHYVLSIYIDPELHGIDPKILNQYKGPRHVCLTCNRYKHGYN